MNEFGTVQFIKYGHISMLNLQINFEERTH